MRPTLTERAARALERQGLRALTDAEIELLTAAEEAGAKVRTDDALADYIAGSGGFPIYFSTYVHMEDMRDEMIVAAADREKARETAFIERCRTGDLAALAGRVQAERVRVLGGERKAAA